MLFGTGRDARKIEQTESEGKRAYEYAVERIYKQDRKGLAIARMSYFDSYTFRCDILGKRIQNPDDFVMYGVVHEDYEGIKRIHCEIKFQNQASENGFVGNCFLTHLITDEKKDRYKRKLMLEVAIWNHDREWCQKSYSCLRDAAVSGNQFCNFRIVTEKIDVGDALNQLVEHGYGPTIKLHEFTMWPTIILPRAPAWAWEEQ